MTLPAPQGVEAPLVFVEKPVGPPQGYGPQSAVVFGQGYDPAPGVGDVKGKIVLFHGMILCERIKDFHALGAVGVIAINPGKVAHWGGGSADLGHRRSRRPAVQARDPRRRGEQAGRRSADRAGAQGRQREAVHRFRRRLVQAASCRWWRSRARERQVRAAARPLRFLGRRRRRQRDRRRLHAGSRAHAVGATRQARAQRAHRLVARPFDRPLRGLDLVRRRLRARSCEELRRAHELRQPRLPRRHRLSVHSRGWRRMSAS